MKLKEMTLRTFDDYDEIRTVGKVPAGTLLSKAWWAIKRNENDADADAAIFVTITASPTADGQITDTGASGTGTVQFSISHTETGTLVPGQEYVGMMKALLNNGKVGTFEKQKIKVIQGIVQAVA